MDTTETAAPTLTTVKSTEEKPAATEEKSAEETTAATEAPAAATADAPADEKPMETEAKDSDDIEVGFGGKFEFIIICRLSAK